MIMKCPVILNNDAVTVFKFNDIDVQVASIKRQATHVNVLFENGRYTIVADNYVEKKPAFPFNLYEKKEEAENESVGKFNHRRNKKTTVDSANEEDGANIASED